MKNNQRQTASKTVIDGFRAVERIYRHAYQVLTTLKEEIRTELQLKAESYLNHQAQSLTDPKSWFYHFLALYLAEKKINLDDFINNPVPVILLQASLFNSDNSEPILRYGVIEKIDVVQTYKNIRFDELFRELMTEIHIEGKLGKVIESEPCPVKTLHCKADIHFDQTYLLDIRKDNHIVDLAKAIVGEFGKYFHLS